MMVLLWIVTTIGIVLGVLKGLSQACQSHRQGHSNGLSICGLWAWFFSGLFLIPYSISSVTIPMLIISVCNVIFSSLMLYYYYFPREVSKGEENG